MGWNDGGYGSGMGRGYGGGGDRWEQDRGQQGRGQQQQTRQAERRPDRRDEEVDQGAQVPAVRAKVISAESVGLPAEASATNSADMEVKLRAAVEGEKFNLLFPPVANFRIPPGFRMLVRVVAFPLPPRDWPRDQQQRLKGHPHWYEVEGKLAPTRVVLDRLFQLAQGSVSYSRRVDDGSSGLFVSFEVGIEVRDPFTGQVRRFSASKSVDFRKKAKVNLQEEKFAAEYSESKARCRAIRSCFGLPAAFSAEEAARPWLVIALVPDIDASDPEVRRMLAAQAIGIVDQVYGGGRSGPPLPPPRDPPFTPAQIAPDAPDPDEMDDYAPDGDVTLCDACGHPVAEADRIASEAAKVAPHCAVHLQQLLRERRASERGAGR